MATAKGSGAAASSSRPERSRKRARFHQVQAEQKAELYKRVVPKALTQPFFTGQYSDELGALLSDMVADGCTLDNISTLPNMPPLRVMLRWIADREHPFHQLYYDAKKLLVALYEERAQTAATQPLIGKRITRRQAVTHDGAVVNLVEEQEADNVERSRLMLNAYQWTLGHLAPKKHGRLADPEGGKPNEQLKALFDSLKAGPVE